jgi:type II secretory pathway pseudopilin PulG
MSHRMTACRGITLVEMLIAMAITLVMIGAVVTIFANVTGSVQKRRATIEMSGQLRHARNVLQRDLAGATCPAMTWQRPESNHGYLEIIEGPLSDANPTALIQDRNSDGDFEDANESGIDPAVSLLPRNNLFEDLDTNGSISDFEREDHMQHADSLVPGGLGDADDILMLTVRNEQEPFVGRVPDPTNPQANLTIQSPLAEVVWFAVENPPNTGAAGGFFGEPGLRTIYRRVLLIAPWAPPYQDGQPGVIRVLPNSVNRNQVPRALAALIAFQEEYDLSVRLAWDPLPGRWKIVANTLSDLTRRENRYEHHNYRVDQQDRKFPFAVISAGMEHPNTQVQFQPSSSDSGAAAGSGAAATAELNSVSSNFNGEVFNLNNFVNAYRVDNSGGAYASRPFCYLEGGSPATARAILNDDGGVVHVVRGLAPLWGKRRGEDVMLTDALAFDLRLFDPGAPLFLEPSTETVLAPSDIGWAPAAANMMPLVGQGAYVDAGYGLNVVVSGPTPVAPWFAEPRWTPDRVGNPLAPGYSLYDTWSFHYEHNGWNEAGDNLVDEGTNGFDDDLAYGVDDVDERETMAPYDRPLRAMQVKLRIFELDTQQIREVTVGQHFVSE